MNVMSSSARKQARSEEQVGHTTPQNRFLITERSNAPRGDWGSASAGVIDAVDRSFLLGWWCFVLYLF